MIFICISSMYQFIALFLLFIPSALSLFNKRSFSPIDNSFVTAMQNGIRSFSTWKHWAKYFDIGSSLGLGDRRILYLLLRILRLNFAHLLRELCPFIIILWLLQFLMKTLLKELNFFWIKFVVCLGVTGSSDGHSVQHLSAFCSLHCP